MAIPLYIKGSTNDSQVSSYFKRSNPLSHSHTLSSIILKLRLITIEGFPTGESLERVNLIHLQAPQRVTILGLRLTIGWKETNHNCAPWTEDLQQQFNARERTQSPFEEKREHNENKSVQ